MYATPADMVSLFGEREVIALSDRALAGAIDAAVLADALEQAAAEIDAYLAGRYALPLARVPRLLMRICCDIARYRLCGNDTQETEPVRNRYKDAHRMLTEIQRGALTLGLDVDQQEVGTRQTVKIINGRRTFSQQELNDY